MSESFLFGSKHEDFAGQPVAFVTRQGRSEIRSLMNRARHAICRSVKALAEGIAESRRMARRYRELAALSERELAEVGMSRSDIPAVVSGTYRRGQHVAGLQRKRPAKEVAIGAPLGSTRRLRSFSVTNATPASNANVVDVRSLVPAQRHAKIFQLVNALAHGASFILVNDHDPKPLYYQLEAEYPKQFSWTYLERGPEVWRVEIGKLAQAA